MNLQDIENKISIIINDKDSFLSGYKDIVFNPVLNEMDLNDYERNNKITLPVEYKDFLTKIGNGGFGPGNGLMPLNLRFNTDPRISSQNNDVIDINKSFPFQDEWNCDELRAEFEKNSAKKDTLMELYFSTSKIDGSICICDMGDGDIILLVVNGNQFGYVWYDGRGNFSGLSPYYVDDKKSVNFFEWYGAWLDEIILKVPLRERTLL